MLILLIIVIMINGCSHSSGDPKNTGVMVAFEKIHPTELVESEIISLEMVSKNNIIIHLEMVSRSVGFVH